MKAERVPEYDTRFMRTGLILAGALVLAMLAGCGDAPERTDVELGLNAQQANGRRVYQTYCAACHKAYSSSGLKGPGLKRLFGKPFLPSGLPANDRFVRQSVVGGRGMMPPLGDSLTEQQLSDLLDYLHTL